jgi:hypothetical protein
VGNKLFARLVTNTEEQLGVRMWDAFARSILDVAKKQDGISIEMGKSSFAIYTDLIVLLQTRKTLAKVVQILLSAKEFQLNFIR